MGDLSTALAVEPRNNGGRKHRLQDVFAAVPESEHDVLRAAFDDPDMLCVQIRRAVMKTYPDAPVFSESTWFKWVRDWRDGEIRV